MGGEVLYAKPVGYCRGWITVYTVFYSVERYIYYIYIPIGISLSLLNILYLLSPSIHSSH